MLKFSNSQSCKEFTLEGEFTGVTRSGDFALKMRLAVQHRCISMYCGGMQIVAP